MWTWHNKRGQELKRPFCILWVFGKVRTANHKDGVMWDCEISHRKRCLKRGNPVSTSSSCPKRSLRRSNGEVYWTSLPLKMLARLRKTFKIRWSQTVANSLSKMIAVFKKISAIISLKMSTENSQCTGLEVKTELLEKVHFLLALKQTCS